MRAYETCEFTKTHHYISTVWPWLLSKAMASVHRNCRDMMIDNRDYRDTIIVMLENPQSLSPT